MLISIERRNKFIKLLGKAKALVDNKPNEKAERDFMILLNESMAYLEQDRRFDQKKFLEDIKMFSIAYAINML